MQSQQQHTEEAATMQLLAEKHVHHNIIQHYPQPVIHPAYSAVQQHFLNHTKIPNCVEIISNSYSRK